MRIGILGAAVLVAAHAVTAGAQTAPAPLPAGDGWVALTIADYLKLRDQANPKPPPPPPPPKGATVSLAKVLSRIDALDKRYHAAGEKAPLPLVALTTKRTDALHANPDELKEIWAWLDRWERSYLPER